MNILEQKVLKLNRAWQVIGETSVLEAIKMMSIDAGTALLIDGNEMRPVKWEEWINLPVVEEDGCIHTQHRNIRRPTVLVCVNYSKIPKRRPKFNLASIARRDGNKCQYTGRQLSRHEMSLDHVVPKSRGGADAPDNVVLAHKEVNNRKGNKLPIEAGLPNPVIRPLRVFEPTPAHPHHELFLIK